MKSKFLPAAFIATGILAAPAQAAGSASCTLATTPLAFGRYVPSRNSPSDFTSTITVTCIAAGTAPVSLLGTIALLNSGGSSGRVLRDGADRLRYQLFLDPGRTIPWGDGSGDSQTKSVSGTVDPNAPFRATLTIYGRVLARQSSTAVGQYADQIIAILQY